MWLEKVSITSMRTIMSNPDIVEATRVKWQAYYEDELTTSDSHEIIQNTARVLNLLYKWRQKGNSAENKTNVETLKKMEEF